MLGWARLAGGGGNAAVESMKQAVQLSPRDEEYQLRLARAYLAAKKFDDATATLERLKASQDPHIAQAANKDLEDLPFLKKYGVAPEEAAASAKSNPGAASNQKTGNDDDEDSDPEVDRGTVHMTLAPRNMKTVITKSSARIMREDMTTVRVVALETPSAVGFAS